MPIFEYRCTKCEHEFEDILAASAPAPPCPQCGAPTEKQLSGLKIGKKTKVSAKAELHDKKRIDEKHAKRQAEAAKK
jgi:putative FmdB family regulatory protein